MQNLALLGDMSIISYSQGQDNHTKDGFHYKCWTLLAKMA